MFPTRTNTRLEIVMHFDKFLCGLHLTQLGEDCSEGGAKLCRRAPTSACFAASTTKGNRGSPSEAPKFGVDWGK